MTESAQIELLAQVDSLIARLQAWSDEKTDWEPVTDCQNLIRRLLQRLEPIRSRVEAPLIVATFGGTGVGKSSLVNALVGREVTQSGRQRPTTTKPVVLVHPETDLGIYQLPIDASDDELQIVKVDAPLLRDIVIIDCPDPDTSEIETQSSNLARLHRLLPFCDVLLYVSTQQKYRSARVSEELLLAASGCRLVFIQSHADLDSDIREDWQEHLSSQFQISDLYYVDSKKAMQEQLSGVWPTGEFGRLLELLRLELSATHRIRIRRGNLMGLVQEILHRANGTLRDHAPRVERLERSLADLRLKTTERMSKRLLDELIVSRGLWEQRLLGQVTQLWGNSPFAMVLKLWHSQASLLASFSLMRSQTTAQMALVGLVHGSRWLTSQQKEYEAGKRIESLSSLGLSDSELREAQIIVSGHVHSARLDRPIPDTSGFDHLRLAADDVRMEFLADATRNIDDLILDAAKKHSHWWTRLVYEIGFSLFPAFLIYRIGRNFFYDSFVLKEPLLDASFYIPAAIFLAIWSAVFVMSYTRRLRIGLTRKIEQLARELANIKAGAGLFPDLEHQCREYSRHRDKLEQFSHSAELIRRDYIANEPVDRLSAKQDVRRSPNVAALPDQSY